MHGVKRSTAPTASAKAARKEKEAAQLKTYLEVEAAFFEAREQGSLDAGALEATARLLSINPEYYTAWNHRRKILGQLFEDPGLDTSTQEKPDLFAALRDGAESEIAVQEAQAGPSQPSAATQALRSRRQRTERKARLLEEDLELTQQALRVHPKVYWIWNHRKWCLIELPSEAEGGEQAADDGEEAIQRREAKWRREMALVDKMLTLDPRNFHGWDYRRFLLSQIAAASLDPTAPDTLPLFPYILSSTDASLTPAVKSRHLRLAKEELSYTLRKIESNFSNFSAWHQRSKILPQVWAAQGKSAVEKRKAIDEEFELLRQAMYTDPADQSVWLYHAWLVDLDTSPDVLQREIESIEELLEVEPDSKWCIESLSRYKKLLADELQKSGTDKEQGDAARERASLLQRESRDLLQRLVDVDPDRRGRWLDLLSAGAN